MAAKHSEELSDLIKEAAKKETARESCFSFGDQGLTASVGATGRLLRITQHFPGQKTGICVDDKDIRSPYLISWRLEDFLRRSIDESLGGIGPRIDSLYPAGDAEHDVVNDRWPTFTRPMSGEPSNKLRVSYVAFQGTIYQKFEIIDTAEKQPPRPEAREFPNDILRTLSLNSEVLIRNLDFVNWDNQFNKALSRTPDGEVPVYTTGPGQAKNHVRREHKIPGQHFVLHLQVLDQSNSLEFHKSDQANTCFGIQKSSNHLQHIVSEVVLAYTLRQGSTSSDLEPLPDWEKFLEAGGLLQHHPMVRLTEDVNLNFFLGRNLEYILSVCSIPVSEADSDGIPAYALTCGDVDGHRVAISASL